MFRFQVALIGFSLSLMTACSPSVHDLNEGSLDQSSFLPPAAESLSQNPSDTNQRSLILYFDFKIDVLLSTRSATCQLNSDPAVDCKSKSFALSNLPDGDHMITVEVTDSMGRKSPTLTHALRVDTVIPTVQLTQTPSAFTGRMTTVSFMGNDNSSGLIGHDCSFDNNPFAPCVSPVALNNLANGAHSLRVRARDRANNVSAIAAANWTVNNNAPVITIANRPQDNTMSRNANFTFSGVLDGVAVTDFQCSLDNAAFAACTSPINYTNLADGQHTFRVQGRNNNNEYMNPVTVTWRVDNIAPNAPTITTNVQPISASANASFMFTANDGNSGIAGYQCSRDGAAFAACTSPVAYMNLAEGAHTFSVRAVDGAGNISQAAVFNWTIDLP